MTGPIIPAELWPEGADRHCWDANGLGFFHVPTTEGAQMWLLVLKQSHIPLPAGWDWRVPVMRPAAVPAIDRDHLLSALERAAAAETELARLRDQQQFPAIDLEQFREAVVVARTYYAEMAGDIHDPAHNDVADCDRLLALIDGQPSVRSSSEHSDSLTPVAHKKLQGLQADGFIVNGVAIFNPATGQRGLVDYLGYVGWQTSEKPSKGEGLWCLHILGPDDIHAAPSKEHAERAAERFNEIYGPVAASAGVMCRAVAAPWPHSPESHAEDVGLFEANWLQPSKGEGE